MSQINKFFGRPEDNSSITHMISELGSQFDALAVSPESEAAQFMAVAAAEDVLREIKQMSDEVQRLRNEANTVLNATINEFNKHVEAVASINGQIINFTNSNLLMKFNYDTTPTSAIYTALTSGLAHNLTFTTPIIEDKNAI